MRASDSVSRRLRSCYRRDEALVLNRRQEGAGATHERLGLDELKRSASLGELVPAPFVAILLKSKLV